MENPTVCLICNNPPTVPCPGCAQLLYSSDACLDADAPSHRFLCPAFASAAQPEEGPDNDNSGVKDSGGVLAILFPADAAKPELVRVSVVRFRDEDTGISFQEAGTDAFFHDGATPQTLHSERNRVRSRENRGMLEVWHLKDDGLANACVRSLGRIDAAGSGKDGGGPFYEWKGPVLVMAMTRPTGFMVDPGAYRDAEPQDFRDALDFVLDYGNDVHGKRLKEALVTLGAENSDRQGGADEGGDGKEQGDKAQSSGVVIEME
jgi:hypothetical protein